MHCTSVLGVYFFCELKQTFLREMYQDIPVMVQERGSSDVIESERLRFVVVRKDGRS